MVWHGMHIMLNEVMLAAIVWVSPYIITYHLLHSTRCHVDLVMLASWLPMETGNMNQRVLLFTLVCIQTLNSPQNLNSWLTIGRTNWCHNVLNNYSKELHSDHIANVCMMQKWRRVRVRVCVFHTDVACTTPQQTTATENTKHTCQQTIHESWAL